MEEKISLSPTLTCMHDIIVIIVTIATRLNTKNFFIVLIYYLGFCTSIRRTTGPKSFINSKKN